MASASLIPSLCVLKLLGGLGSPLWDKEVVGALGVSGAEHTSDSPPSDGASFPAIGGDEINDDTYWPQMAARDLRPLSLPGRPSLTGIRELHLAGNE